MADILPGERPWHERDQEPQGTEWDAHQLSNFLENVNVQVGPGVVWLALVGRKSGRRVFAEMSVSEAMGVAQLISDAAAVAIQQKKQFPEADKLRSAPPCA